MVAMDRYSYIDDTILIEASGQSLELTIRFWFSRLTYHQYKIIIDVELPKLIPPIYLNALGMEFNVMSVEQNGDNTQLWLITVGPCYSNEMANR
jgi:hypothetical protein